MDGCKKTQLQYDRANGGWWFRWQDLCPPREKTMNARELARKRLTWTKEGGHDGSRFIRYTSNAGYEINRTRIGGEWTKPCLYLNDKFVLGFNTVAEAKNYAEQMVLADESTDFDQGMSLSRYPAKH